MDNNTSRRALIGGAGIAAVLVAAPVIADPARSAFSVAHANHLRAVARFNGLPEHLEDISPEVFAHEEELYGAAADALDAATPTTWGELIVLMEHMIGGGSYPGKDGCNALIAHTRRLAKREG